MSQKEKYLGIYLSIFGIVNMIFLSFAPILLGDLLLWQPRNIPTELMMASLYFALGVIMLRSAKKPLEHKSLIDFVILGNILHSAIMFFTAEHLFHFGDALIIGIEGILPLFFYPWGLKHLWTKQN